MPGKPRQPRGTPAGGEFAAILRTEPGITLAVGWPGIASEEHDWRGEPYSSAIVPKIADLDPRVNPHTQALVEQATMDMVRFDAELGEDSAMGPLLTHAEAASSSRIENLAAGARDVALARLAGMRERPSTAAALVASNIRAQQMALELSGDLSLKGLAVIHFTLLEATAPDIAGVYRRTPGWIGGMSPHNARFVPPHPERVMPAMNDLVAFMQRVDIPVLTQAAVAHAQFETIHPFADGNGRTGRAIVSALLRAKDVTRHATMPVSSGLLAGGTRAYVDALGEFRQGNITPIVELYAEASFRAVHNSRLLAGDLRSARAQSLTLIGSAAPSARRVLELLARQPAITADLAAEHAGLSTATAYRAIELLEVTGILVPAGKIHGVSAWTAHHTIEALDSFEARASRR